MILFKTSDAQCSICGKCKNDTRVLFFFKNKGFYVCVDCKDRMKEPIGSVDGAGMSPKQISSNISQFVIGQDDSIKGIAVAVYKHYLYINNYISLDMYKKIKNNILIVGPSGSGKTYTIDAIAKMLNIPVGIADASCITPAGFVGDDVSSGVAELCKKTEDMQKIERGIVVYDEFDKILNMGTTSSGTNTSRSVQSELLRFIGGGTYTINLDKRALSTINVDTSGMLFFFTGAFTDVLKSINAENEYLKSQKNFSFSNVANESSNPYKKEIIKAGMLPELISRIGVLSIYNELGKEDTIKILKSPNGRLDAYINLFVIHGYEVKICEKSYELIAEKSMELKSGARGIEEVLDILFTDWLFDNFSNSNTKNLPESKENKDSPEEQNAQTVPKNQSKANDAKDSDHKIAEGKKQAGSKKQLVVLEITPEFIENKLGSVANKVFHAAY